MCDGADDGGWEPRPAASRGRWWASTAFRAGLAAAALGLSYGLAAAQQTQPDYIVGGIFNTTPPTYTNLQRAPLQVDATGGLRIAATLVATCGLGNYSISTLTVDGTGALCSNASVVNGTFDDTLTAIAALPTLAPGTQRPRGSLAGAYYVQPVFGSTAGGGTQVDSTHGLPADVKASVLPTGAATSALQTTGNTALTTINTTLGSPLQAGGTVGLSSQYPVGATALTASGTGTTGATAATLAATGGKTTYICGFSITSDATAALAGAAAVTGTITGTLNYLQGVGLAPAVAALNQTFAPCIPASTTNTTIVVTSAAAGTGGVTAVTAWGFQL